MGLNDNSEQIGEVCYLPVPGAISPVHGSALEKSDV